MSDYIKLHELDNVGVLITPREGIPAGHKIALRPIAKGEKVIKYGCPIGTAQSDIKEGEWIHSHNLKTALSGEKEYTYDPQPIHQSAPFEGSFMGYEREDGKVGIRNEIWILPLVGCVNHTAQRIAAEGSKLGPAPVYTFPHPYGCSQLGDDHARTRELLCALVRHPNAGGVLVLSLGCENNTLDAFKEHLGPVNEKRVKFLVCQEHEDEEAAALELIGQLQEELKQDQRTPQPVSKLVIGLKCGGSDGFSGITANPLLGAVSDGICAAGGTALLTEVPEMFGAEELLMARCRNEEVFQKTCDLVNGFKKYYQDNHMPVYENPSPGNKAGGITTLEDKALGCTQKSGSSPVRGVLKYAEKVRVPGLNLLSAPGNDLVASTALAVSGAQLVLFSTGRGTPFGCPVPTVKIASNSPLAQKKRNWIDFDAGRLLSGMTLDELGQDLMDYVLAVAGGKLTRNEINGFHDMAIFKQGVTL